MYPASNNGNIPLLCRSFRFSLYGILNTTVEVDGEHALGACADATGAEGVTEAVVLDLVAQAAARRQRVGVVAEVGEEGVSFGVHLGGEVAPFLVDDVAIFR